MRRYQITQRLKILVLQLNTLIDHKSNWPCRIELPTSVQRDLQSGRTYQKQATIPNGNSARSPPTLICIARVAALSFGTLLVIRQMQFCQLVWVGTWMIVCLHQSINVGTGLSSLYKLHLWNKVKRSAIFFFVSTYFNRPQDSRFTSQVIPLSIS